MTLFADILVTSWIVFVGIVYFGTSIFPDLGTRTWQLGVVYVVMLLASLAFAFLNRAPQSADAPSLRPGKS